MLLLACAESSSPTGAPRDTAVEAVPGESGATGPRVQISEVMSANTGSSEDGDGDPSDWIELYNPGPERVPLAGWELSGWPLSGELVGGEFLVIWASGKGESGPAGEVHTDFALDRDGERVELTREDGTIADAVEVPALDDDTSWGREQVATTTTLVGPGSPATLSATEQDGWAEAGFDDGAWTPTTLGIGFDLGYSDATEENAALDAPTAQSSDYSGFTGAGAVDGEPGTISHTGTGDLEPTWEVDLEADWLVSSVTILNRADCCAERLYNVTVSLLDAEGEEVWASEVLNPVDEGATPTDPGSLLTVTPDEPMDARAVRLSKVAVNGSGSSEWLSMAEVTVTAALASPYLGDFETDVSAAVTTDAFIRARFATDAPDRLTLAMRWDDGFAAYLANELVAEDAADEAHDGDVEQTWTLDPSLAQGGLLAVRATTLDADDLLLSPTLSAQWIEEGDAALFTTPTPGGPNGEGVAGELDEPSVDPPRGFFEEATEVTITADEAATIRYTTDGSTPTREHGTEATGAATVTLDTTGVLRALAFRDGWTDSDVATHTYLFLDDVIRQPAAPEGVPTVWDGISEAAYDADYEMDPDVVDDPAYAEDLVAGLREIPTLSLVLEPEDLWGDEGIYVNSAERGEDWERPASVEWILPDGSTGFQEDCGVRVHGYGWRYHSSTLKHSFRLEFSRDYGVPKLEYPVFGDAPVERFDSIVLRAGGSKTWLDFRDPAQAQYLHDSFARDTARDMGKTDGHSTYVHLYLNGLYWGLYNPVERPEAGFGEEYFGGDDDEYDAINRRTVTNEAVDGDLEAYNALLSLADADLSDDENLAAVESMLDLDDLIDYMLIHQYTVNRDGPCCFESNNMRGLRRRVDGEQFRFFVWDMEYSLWDASDSTNVDIDVSGSISHVYTRLRDNASFRQRFAERAKMHLEGGGALTADVAAARYAARAAEIWNPLVAESARWGDTYREEPYSRDVEWVEEYTRLIDAFFPYRTGYLIEQLREAGLYE
jgi:hypothetical protein